MLISEPLQIESFRKYFIERLMYYKCQILNALAKHPDVYCSIGEPLFIEGCEKHLGVKIKSGPATECLDSLDEAHEVIKSKQVSLKPLFLFFKNKATKFSGNQLLQLEINKSNQDPISRRL